MGGYQRYQQDGRSNQHECRSDVLAIHIFLEDEIA